jgi:3'-phosphoadenosine 5'-phosphosulfate sulfotransferase (PAPS reductase)/FAD synthetase
VEHANNYLPNREPLFVSYGMGVDSTAELVGLQQRGIRPDLILFSDTGDEKPETYAYLEVINEWLEEVGFPQVQVVRYEPTRAPYSTLEGQALANHGMPAPAFGGHHTCAIVFKRDVLNKALKLWAMGRAAIASGKRIRKAIGYADTTEDRTRSTKAFAFQAKMRAEVKSGKGVAKKTGAPLASHWEAENCDLWAPLQDWGLSREDLPALIESAGLPVPPKSACWHCPVSKLGEVMDLKRNHPDHYGRAVAIEENYQNGPNYKVSKPGQPGTGLGMTWAWGWIRDAKTDEEAREIIEGRGGKVTKQLRP